VIGDAASHFGDWHGEGYLLPPTVQTWLQKRAHANVKLATDSIPLETNSQQVLYQSKFHGQACASVRFTFRLTDVVIWWLAPGLTTV
jgi:hypothetical protein